MSYVIAQESYREEELQFLVDRNRIKDRWWSHELRDAMIFQCKADADQRAKTLRLGIVSVMDLKEAHRYMDETQAIRDHEDVMLGCEDSF